MSRGNMSLVGYHTTGVVTATAGTTANPQTFREDGQNESTCSICAGTPDGQAGLCRRHAYLVLLFLSRPLSQLHNCHYRVPCWLFIKRRQHFWRLCEPCGGFYKQLLARCPTIKTAPATWDVAIDGAMSRKVPLWPPA